MELSRCCVIRRRAAVGFSVLVLLAASYYLLTHVSRSAVSLVVVDHSFISGTPLTAPSSGVGHSHRLDFNLHEQDTLVFIHIQKTGGSTFLRHLVTLRENHTDLCVQAPKSSYSKKKERYVCPRKAGDVSGGGQWLVSEKTMGWICGLHAFYSEFVYCLQRERGRRLGTSPQLHFSTMLRHPVVRYLSEYLHVQRGASWSTRHKCNGVEVTDQEMPPCYPGYYNREPWHNITFDEFVLCSSNWANNRQTLMLADLSALGCFNRDPQHDRRLLESAKQNLLTFAFFGLTEYFNESCQLFEATLGLEFGKLPAQRPASQLYSAPILQKLWNSNETYHKIARANHLDMELYAFARTVFSQRMQAIGVPLDKQKLEKQIAEITFNDVSLKRFSKLNYDHIT